jgi:hypothetical protein
MSSDPTKGRPGGPCPVEKRVAIIQSAYIPWIGLFDLVSQCDEYVIFDSVQFAKRHWHNRNKIKTSNGVRWLTIPVASKSRFLQTIDEVEIAQPWAESRWRALEEAYRHAPYFSEVAARVRPLYEKVDGERLLTRVNEALLRTLVDLLGLSVKITRDREYDPQGKGTERLVDICRKVGASRYLSGPSARAYLDPNAFTVAAIGVDWMTYGPYAEYPQLHGPFEVGVSVLDPLFHLGPGAATLIHRVMAPEA